MSVEIDDEAQEDRKVVRLHSGDWKPYELELLERLWAEIRGPIKLLELDQGITERGDPYTTLVDAPGHPVISVSRVGGKYVLEDHRGCGGDTLEGLRLRELLDRFRDRNFV